MTSVNSARAIFLLVITCFSLINAGILLASASAPAQLALKVGPSTVPADNSIYNNIVIQLQSSNGAPARAQQDTTISLSSSLTSVGTVENTVTIQKGSTYAQASFHSTFTPGTTTISATASGYATIQTPITTVAPVPSTVAVYGLPSTLPADGNSYPAIVVQLQDSSGSPAKAPIGNVVVSLSSSNAAMVGSVDSNVTIQAGSTYATANFQTVPSNVINTTVITAMCSGYNSGRTTIETTPLANSPTRLALYLGPPEVPANSAVYNQVFIQLQNSMGFVAQSNAAISVLLSSSATNVGKIQQTTTIPAGETGTTVQFNSTYGSGSTMITAAATNLASAQQSITTVGPTPSKLAVYCAPSSLPADDQSYNAITVQLQDSSGMPAYDPTGSLTVYLFSSAPDAGNVNSTLTIPFGSTYAAGEFSTTYLAGSTTITAQASGYDSGQANIETYVIDQSTLSVSVSAKPEVALSGRQVNVTAYVSINGLTPVAGATVKFQSDKGENFTVTKVLGNGYYSANFTTPNFSSTVNCTITAMASGTGYNNGQGTTQVEVVAANVGAASSKALGEIRIQVIDENGNAVNDVNILSTEQPAGSLVLSAKTNVTGYATFLNAISGNYTFMLTKDGYSQQKKNIQLPQSGFMFQAVTISKAGSDSSFTSNLVIIVPVIVVAIIAALLILIMLRRRRNNDAFFEDSADFASQDNVGEKTQEVLTNDK